MAEAIVRAVLAKGLARPEQIWAADPAAARRELFKGLGVNVTEDNAAVAGKVKTLLLCCKPQQMGAALPSVREALAKDVLVISIAAGTSIAAIGKGLGEGRKVIRVMPNTPLMAGAGMSALAAGAGVSRAELATARAIFESAGKVVEVPEELMDAVTAVSGSGPAYYFLMTEQLTKAAIELGLEPATADLLARQTALGSALMLTQSADSPAELRRKVTSPGGTTQAAIETMEAGKLSDVFRAGVAAAERRGRELRG